MVDWKHLDNLIISRGSVYRFLLRCKCFPEFDLYKQSTVGKLWEFIDNNERELIAQSVDVLSIKLDTDFSSVINSSFVGLFWFNEDYTDVIDLCGVREFTKGDVLAKTNISPDGGHIDFSENTHSTPRGRVSLHDGHVVISVGTECPDFALQRVVDAFGLGGYKGNKLRIFKDVHWDTKGISGSGY